MGGYMQKKLLLIINPVSGMRKANRFLTDIITTLSTNGYECQVQATTPVYNAQRIAMNYAKEKDLIVCIGGDGTLNETVSGCLATNGKTPPIGYIPSGSTNDFANGLRLPHHPLKGLAGILSGNIHMLDVGLFNGKPFVYTASFGAFTKASYTATREMRNVMGYAAYVLEGAKEIADIRSYSLCIETPDRTVTGDYIFGGICNAKQIGGGIIQFADNVADLSDGLLEVLLMKMPKTPADLMQLIFDLNAGNYNSEFLECFSAKSIRIATTDEIDWTIDGEYQAGSREVSIDVLPGVLQLQY
jgi:YegS/Rv2252/BmrU family lipid kinase